VLAGPGAGKTFCLIERIRHFVEVQGIPPARICAVTYTNRAAGEIAGRLHGSMGPHADDITAGTIHSLCVLLLREHGERIGVPRGFGIADESYQVQVLRRLGVPKEPWARSRLNDFSRHRLAGADLHPESLQLLAAYKEWLASRSLLDYDDLVIRAAQLLEIPDVRVSIAGRWDAVLVDECQDLNPVQYDIVKALAEGHRNLFAVGDDEQSIFSWTGAVPRVLEKLAGDFGVRSIIVLEENRRNARGIFETARRLLRDNPTLFKKTLRATRESPHGVEAMRFEEDDEEVAWILEDIVRDRAEAGLPWGEYGILYRKHEVGSRIEGALLRAGIPSRLAVGRALQDEAVVKYLVAALRVIAAPGDPVPEESFARVVLPETLYQRLTTEAEASQVELLDWLRRSARRGQKEDPDTRKLRRFQLALDNLHALGRKHTTITGLVEELLAQRVGVYRTLLEERHEELSDPAEHAEVRALAGDLATAMHGKRRVWLKRLGGVEIALAGMLRGGGVTSVGFLDAAVVPSADDLVLDPGQMGPLGPGLATFKALQLAHGREIPEAFRDFVAFDLETTDKNVEGCEIVEIAAVRVRNGNIVDEFQSLVLPRVPIAARASEVHGYTEEKLRAAGAPYFEAVWPAFRAFVGNDVLLAHNGHWFDFPILRRMAEPLGGAGDITMYDTLPLARDLHPGSRRLGDLAAAFGIELLEAHHALDDARALALVFLRLEAGKLARARKTALVNLLDWLGLALALGEWATLSDEAGLLLRLTRAWALGRYSNCLDEYAVERERPGAAGAPTHDEVIERLGGRQKMLQLRSEKSALDRYPAAMERLGRILHALTGTTLEAQLAQLLERVALSKSDGVETDHDRVNLLTLHATKGLEFKRVYIIGVEDAELPGIRQGRVMTKGEMEEARRLLYVGMTRAEDRLVLTRVRERHGVPTGGAQFLDELGL
jgi:superfamily I DNA/RNA helicase/DNA polymerase III epsilon subunit-like protein